MELAVVANLGITRPDLRAPYRLGGEGEVRDDSTHENYLNDSFLHRDGARWVLMTHTTDNFRQCRKVILGQKVTRYFLKPSNASWRTG